MLKIAADRTLVRAGARSRRFVRAEIQVPEAPRREGRRPVSLAFVLDRSGSMHGAKIASAREAVLQGIRSLRSDDRFAVVAYDGEVDVVVPATPASAEARRAAVEAVARIAPRGSTDLHGGWQRGCEQVAGLLAGEAVGRCLLLTDGRANAGITDHDELVRQAAGWRDRRVSTSTLGVGADFDETLLRRMADAGGGNFCFVESAGQITDFVASEVGEALAIVAREAVLLVDAGEGARVESVNDYPCTEEDGRFRIRLGSLFSGQLLEAIVRVTFPKGAEGEARDVTLRLEDADGALGRASGSVRFAWADDERNDRQPRDRAVDRRVAALYAARAERDALERNRGRDYEGAGRVLARCIERIQTYAGDDAELLLLVEHLKRRTAELEVEMSPMERKHRYALMNSSLKSRPGLTSRPLVARDRVRLLVEPDLVPVVQPVMAHLAAADPALFGRLTLDALPEPWVVRPGVRLKPSQEEGQLAKALRHAPSDAVHVVLTTAALYDNWFSHWHGGSCAAVVSMPGPGTAGVVDPRAFVAYEIAHHGLRLLGPAWAPERLAHKETRGCVFDFCEHRSDIEIKLQTADLCPACETALAQAGFPLDRLRRLLEVVRTLAAPAEVVH